VLLGSGNERLEPTDARRRLLRRPPREAGLGPTAGPAWPREGSDTLSRTSRFSVPRWHASTYRRASRAAEFDLVRGSSEVRGPAELGGSRLPLRARSISTRGQPTRRLEPSFGFNAQSDLEDAKGNCNVIDHPANLHIKCLTVDSLVVAGTHATFFGQATVDKVATNYRIDVDDLGEPGLADTFKIQTDTGYSAAGRLEGGNVQIHR
jgi:hypothetical protein